MFGILSAIAFIGGACQLIKEATTPVIPAENWANKELIHQDIMKGVPIEQRLKNAQNGKYKLTETYPEPHKNERGQIIVENCQLYNKDLKEYGAVQTMKWVKQGKYNLEGEALQKEHERIQKKYEYLYSLK